MAEALPALMEGVAGLQLSTPPKFVDVSVPMSTGAPVKKHLGCMDILDLSDMERIQIAEVFQEAFFVPLRESPMDFSKTHYAWNSTGRLLRETTSVTIPLSISLRDLACWSSNSTQKSPCNVFPFLENPGLATRRFVPLQASLRILTNPADLPVEFHTLNVGSSLAMRSLETRTNLLGIEAARGDPVLATYMELTKDDACRLVYQSQIGSAAATDLLPPSTPEHIEALRRKSFIENLTIDRGTSQVFISDAKQAFQRRQYRIVPESHGMAEQLKINLKDYVSCCRVFAGSVDVSLGFGYDGSTKPNDNRLFLRVPEASFIAAATKFKQDKLLYEQEQVFGDVAVYVALARPGDADYCGAAARPHDPEGFDKKYTIQVQLVVDYLYPHGSPHIDIFMANPTWMGKFPEGLDYMDPLSDQYTQNADKSWVLMRRAEIPPEIAMEEYLTEHRVRRVNYIKKALRAYATPLERDPFNGEMKKAARHLQHEHRPDLNYLEMLYQDL